MKFLHTGSGNWSSWDTIPQEIYFWGCIDEINNLYKPQDIYIYI